MLNAQTDLKTTRDTFLIRFFGLGLFLNANPVLRDLLYRAPNQVFDCSARAGVTCKVGK